MEIELSLKKSLEENAAHFFDRAKRAKKKREGAKKKLIEVELELADLQKKQGKERDEWEANEEHKLAKQEQKAKQPWYFKFRWFRSSEGFLIIGGRDATTNDIIIKKYADPDDWVFHTDMAGSLHWPDSSPWNS